MHWIHSKYASLINTRVRNYERLSPNLWNFSCPICGDSEKHKRKARGYIYHGKDKLRYHCHNCGASMTFDTFLRELDEGLYMEMKKELLQEGDTKPPVVIFAEKLKTPKHIKNSGLINLKKVSQLLSTHFCKKYVDERGIPPEFHHELFFCPKFKDWTNSMLPGKFGKLDFDEPRLIIPFFTREKQMIGYQGRSFNPDDPVRYITIILDETKPRIYGLDRVNSNHRYYGVEGPIDAMFLKNSVASCGSDIVSELEQAFMNKENAVIVYDNEPRNKDTVKKVARAIRKGYKVVVWPEGLAHKDLNDMMRAGYPYHQTILGNIYKGLEAEIKLNAWKRVGN